MKIKFTAIASLTIVAASTLILGSCTADKDSSGLEYMPDMYRSPAIEPYVDYGEIRGRENKAFKMKQSSLTPPSNTIPYYGTDSSTVMLMLPYHRKANLAFRETHGMYNVDLASTDEYLASAVDVNPLKLTAENSEGIFKMGKTLFASNCLHCHGEAGDGNGPMVASGAYAGVPNYKNLTITEGQMFYSIYYGRNAMGAHSSILNKKEIWTLVHYVKKFQNADYGKFDANVAVAVSSVTDSLAVKTK